MLRAGTTEHWIAVLEKAGIPCGPVNNVAQALAHPQTAARNMLVAVDDPVTGPLKLAGNPMKFSAFADPPTRDAAPDLDADRDRILARTGIVKPVEPRRINHLSLHPGAGRDAICQAHRRRLTSGSRPAAGMASWY